MSGKSIAFLCSSTSWGGLEMNIVRFARWFQEEGYSVVILGVEGSPIHKDVSAGDLEFIRIRKHRKYLDFRQARLLARLFEDREIDVVWIRDTRDMDVLSWAKRRTRREVKVIYQQAMQLGVPKKDLIHTHRFRAIDHWIAPLAFLAEQVRTMTRFPSERISVVPLALEDKWLGDLPEKKDARTLLNLPENALLLGNVGRIDPLKGQDFLLETFLSLAPSYPSLQLVIAGDPTRDEGNAFLEMLQKKAKETPHSNRIHFIPHRSDVEQLYSSLDVFAMTSVGETFGMVTIEAMACGLPVIGTNTSGTPELLEDGNVGALYTPGSQTEFVAGVIPWLENQEARVQTGQRARTSAHTRFSKEAVMKQLMALAAFID